MATEERHHTERDVSFTTLSGEPIRALYTESDLPPDADASIGLPGEFPFTRGVYPSDVSRAVVDDAAVRGVRDGGGDQRALPLSARPRADGAVHGVRHAVADGPRLRPRAQSLGEVGREGVAVDTLDDMETLFEGIDLGEVSVSMTINAPAAIMMAFYVVAAEEKGIPADRLQRHGAGGHPQGVHRAEGVVLPGRSGDAAAGGHDAVVHGAHAALASGLDQRLPHPRGGLDGGAGARVHAQGRPDLRRGAGRARDGRRRLRAAAELLLQRAHRLLRGDRQVPCGAPDLGARAARDVRRQAGEVVADALSHADRRRVADGAAAAQQRRAHGDRGARGRARRDAVAAHQLPRRGARAAVGGGGAGGAAHAADHRRTRPA